MFWKGVDGIHCATSDLAVVNEAARLHCPLRLTWRIAGPRLSCVSCVLLQCSADGCSGHGSVRLLVATAADSGFQRSSDEGSWIRTGCSPPRMISVQFSTFVVLFMILGRIRMLEMRARWVIGAERVYLLSWSHAVPYPISLEGKRMRCCVGMLAGGIYNVLSWCCTG